MLSNTRCGLYLVAVALLTETCFAQDPIPAKFYKLDFAVKEVEAGKVLNSRSYWAIVSTEHVDGPLHCSLRTGSKVPYSTGKEYTYLDLGVSIDCRAIKEVAGQLTLYVVADISSALQEAAASPGVPPTVRQNRWASVVVLPFKKPTVIFSSDDVASKHQMQLELTATPII